MVTHIFSKVTQRRQHPNITANYQTYLVFNAPCQPVSYQKRN